MKELGFSPQILHNLEDPQNVEDLQLRRHVLASITSSEDKKKVLTTKR